MNQSFASLGLIDPLLKAIDELNYRKPTPVQQKSIPSLLEGKDMLAAAQTGTGKTAAYSLPIIQKIAESGVRAKPKEVTALILAPTRELAAQIHENITAYSKYLDIRSALVFGGVNLKPQTAALARGVDILIATPGRLLDHLGQKHVSLSAVKFLVLDEADRMLDMGFIHDIRKLIKLIPENRQSLLFSATFSPEIRKLADSLLNSPVSVEISPNKESALIEQQAYAVPKNRKRELLRDLIVDEKWSQVLVFTRMKHAANRLCQQLIKDGLTAAAIHGNKSQNARTKALADFKDKKVQVLVATDIAARGLDIEQLPHVVNYDLPDVPEDYVHRIGRTGRAGEEGFAISFVTRETMKTLKEIEKLIGKDIPFTTIEGYETDPSVLEKPKRGERKGGTRRGGNKPAGARRTGEKHAERAEREGRRPNAGEGRRRREDDTLVTRGERGGRGGKGRFDRKDRGGRFDRDNRNDRGGNKGGYRGKGGAGRNGEWLSDEEFRSRRNAKNAQARLHKKERKAQNGAPHKANNKKRGGEGGYDYSRFSK